MAERGWEFLKEKKEPILVVLMVAALYGLFFAFYITCPIKAMTGISCPGCGMTRAWLSLLRLDVAGAWHYHPLFLLPPVWLAAFLGRKGHPWLYKACTAAGILLLLVVYAMRMADGTDEVVVFRPLEGFLFRWLG